MSSFLSALKFHRFTFALKNTICYSYSMIDTPEAGVKHSKPAFDSERFREVEDRRKLLSAKPLERIRNEANRSIAEIVGRDAAMKALSTFVQIPADEQDEIYIQMLERRFALSREDTLLTTLDLDWMVFREFAERYATHG